MIKKEEHGLEKAKSKQNKQIKNNVEPLTKVSAAVEKNAFKTEDVFVLDLNTLIKETASEGDIIVVMLMVLNTNKNKRGNTVRLFQVPCLFINSIWNYVPRQQDSCTLRMREELVDALCLGLAGKTKIMAVSNIL